MHGRYQIDAKDIDITISYINNLKRKKFKQKAFSVFDKCSDFKLREIHTSRVIKLYLNLNLKLNYFFINDPL